MVPKTSNAIQTPGSRSKFPHAMAIAIAIAGTSAPKDHRASRFIPQWCPLIDETPTGSPPAPLRRYGRQGTSVRVAVPVLGVTQRLGVCATLVCMGSVDVHGECADGVASLSGGQGRRRTRLRFLAFLASVVWVGILLVGVAYGVLVEALGPTYCELTPGSSAYGELGWSVLPPGPTCTFTEAVHGIDAVRGPYPVMSIWLAFLAIGGMLCIALFRRSRTHLR